MSGMVNVNSEVTDSFYRYKMPRILAQVEGKGNGIKTVTVNMVDIAKALSRPPAFKYNGTNNGIRLETVISDLDYADDICLLEDNADDAQSLLNRVVAAAKEVGLIVNASKTKCMVTRTDQAVLYLDCNPLENVIEFVYLGNRKSSNGNIATKVQNKIARTTANSSRLAKFWKNKGTREGEAEDQQTR
ncbi:uncharacterized protein LOC134856217 [Symsagittifera roscoffensis]|uniref:uncharacterized protein LOC134856217 n=1 Tax=Symsagittifera roscoffensis TaxID=84072 RepID=UPI00307B52C6